MCQCGADGLAGDPMDSFNLSLRALGRCLQYILNWNLPLLLLGGGRHLLILDHENLIKNKYLIHKYIACTILEVIYLKLLNLTLT